MDVLAVIEESLVLLNKLVPDQATRLAKEINNLRESWREEYSKGSHRDDAFLDLLELRMLDIRSLFSVAIKAAQSTDKH